MFGGNPTYQLERLNGLCSEECLVDWLAAHKIGGRQMPWVKMRCETSDRNLRERGVERTPLATISAERQRRLDEVRKLFDEGISPVEIGKRLGHKHTTIYVDLKALGIDVAKVRATEAAESKGRLLGCIKQGLDDGLQIQEIAAVVGISAAMVGHHVRKNFKIDGRKRPASRRNKLAAQGIEQ